MRLSKPLVDITTLNAIESVLRDDSAGDPWGHELAGKFADVYAYSDSVRYVLPFPGTRAAGIDATIIPPIVGSIRGHEQVALTPHEYRLGERVTLDERYLDAAVDGFLAWVRTNRRSFRRWIAVHSESWISGRDSVRIPARYIYDVAEAEERSDFQAVANELSVARSELCYAFDITLRYGLYGQLAGSETFYLSHPIREQPEMPTRESQPWSVPPIALSFGASVQALAKNLTVDQYASLLAELRNVVQSEKLDRVAAGAVERAEAKRIAADLQLPARLKGWAKLAGFSSAAVGGFAAVPVAGIAAAATLGSAAMAIGTIFLNGNVPAWVSKARWLRWAFEWELESHAKN